MIREDEIGGVEGSVSDCGGGGDSDGNPSIHVIHVISYNLLVGVGDR